MESGNILRQKWIKKEVGVCLCVCMCMCMLQHVPTQIKRVLRLSKQILVFQAQSILVFAVYLFLNDLIILVVWTSAYVTFGLERSEPDAETGGTVTVNQSNEFHKPQAYSLFRQAEVNIRQEPEINRQIQKGTGK